MNCTNLGRVLRDFPMRLMACWWMRRRVDLSLSLVGSVVVTNTKLGEDIFAPSLGPFYW